jgi:O-antigen/teichoic acid export membrane protein
VRDNRKLAKNTVISYFRLITAALFGLFSSRFLLESLGTNAFGLYTVVGSVVVMLGFINTIMIPATYRFISFEMGKSEKGNINMIFNVSLLIHLLLAVLILIISETAGVYYIENHLVIEVSSIDNATQVLRFSTFAAICTIITIPYLGLLTAFEKFSVIAVIEIIKSFLMFLLAVSLLYYDGNRLGLYAVLVFVIMFFCSGLFLVYCYKNYYSIIYLNIQSDKRVYKEIFSFSFWIMFGAASSVGQKSGTALILNNFFGTSINASYGLASNVNGVVSTLSGSLSQVAVPQITQNFSSGNKARSVQLTAYITKYTSYMMLILVTPIILETDLILKLWLNNVPPMTAIMCKLIIINSFLGSMTACLPGLIQATGKIKWFQIINSIISLITLPITWILFTMNFPSYIVFITFILSSMLNLIIWQILLKKIMNFDIVYFMKTAYLRLSFVLAFLLPIFFIRSFFDSSLFTSIIFLAGIVLYTIALVYFIGLNSSEKTVISTNIKKIMHIS